MYDEIIIKNKNFRSTDLLRNQYRCLKTLTVITSLHVEKVNELQL